MSIHYEDSGLSGETRALVEAEVKRLLTTAYERAKSLLHSHEAELHALAKVGGWWGGWCVWGGAGRG